MDRIKFKKDMKTILSVVIFLLAMSIPFAVSNIISSWVEIWPWSQRDTEWVSVDCYPIIEIDARDIDGAIIIDGEKIPFDIFYKYERVQILVETSVENMPEMILEFKCKYYAEDEFSAKVTYSNVPYFEVGQKITLRRVD